MSAPEKMECLSDPCPTPLSCSNAGTCAARRDDSARSYDEAIAACRVRGLTPFTEYQRHNRANGGWFHD